MFWSLIATRWGAAAGPMFMIVLNISIVVTELCCTGRLKPNAFAYIFRYASTVPSALRGDVGPFIVTLSS
jgi:hypothetical protein